ncbi:hypothetical protein DMH04_19160 [Kibdelosporangium aridum]|uniref:Uncharacterized protein n=1 Tax=Kibdelosporangium aridum TaxID=2030 RepID=A0A428ZAH4_KIBAR|nr:hypothetical protein DMH04_19160 [Kibdelosporangium aridum]
MCPRRARRSWSETSSSGKPPVPRTTPASSRSPSAPRRTTRSSPSRRRKASTYRSTSKPNCSRASAG